MRYKKKLFQVYLPFLAALFISLSIYTFFHWLIIYRLHLIPLSNPFTNVFLPAIIQAALLFLYHLRVMKKMDMTADKRYVRNENWTFIYGFVLWVVLSVPTVMAQFYLKSVAGEWRTLSRISEIVQHRPAPFYLIEDPRRLHFVKEHTGSYYDKVVKGRYRSTYKLSIDMVVPVFDSPGDAKQDRPAPAWLGLTFKKSMGNYTSKKEKRQAHRDLSDRAWKDLEEKDLSDFVFLERVYRKRYVKALDNNPWYDVSNRNILIPVHEAINSYRYGYLKRFLIALTSGCLLWLGMVLLRPLNEECRGADNALKTPYDIDN